MSGIVGNNTNRSSGIVKSSAVGADSIDGSNIVDDAIDSEHYTDGSIDNAHIADDAIDSEHYAAGSIDEAHIANNAVTLAKMAGGTDGQIITFDASGDPVAVGPGSDGEVLTSTGAGSPPAFEAAGGGLDSITDNGTEEAINIDSNEIVTMPKQPGFDSYVSTEQSNVTGDGTGYLATGAFWTDLVDKNSDIVDGLFTAPVTGLYVFSCIINTPFTAGHTVFDVRLSFSNAARILVSYNTVGNFTHSNFLDSRATIAYMDAADTVGLQFVISGSTKVCDLTAGDDTNTCRISGALL